MKKLVVIVILIVGIYYFMSGSESESDSQDQATHTEAPMVNIYEKKRLEREKIISGENMKVKVQDKEASDKFFADQAEKARKRREEQVLYPGVGQGVTRPYEDNFSVDQAEKDREKQELRKLLSGGSLDKPKSDEE